MSAIVKQLIEGFVESDKKTWILASSSVTLIKDSGANILVDVGGRGYLKRVEDVLKKEKLSLKDIDIVINSHSHPDHCWNNAFFPKAKFISFMGTLEDKMFFGRPPQQITENVEIIATPGHSEDSISVIVKTEKGVCAVVGDLFYSDKEKIPSFEKNVEMIKENRKKILEISDFVIPGHGKMFSSK